MRLRPWLSREQVEAVHRGALRILAECGVKVEHEGVRARLEAVGGQQTSLNDRVRFAPSLVERLIAEAPRSPMPEGPPKLGLMCNVYQSLYMDPATRISRSFTEADLGAYFALARVVPGGAAAGLLGVPFVPDNVPQTHLALAERLYAWKYGARPHGSVHLTWGCQAVVEMCQCHAAMSGMAFEDVFSAVGYLVSPLRLARAECEQLLWFDERGLRMGIGHIPSVGCTAPVTLGGTLALVLAERLFLFILSKAFTQEAVFSVAGTTCAVDMRTAAPCFGRAPVYRVSAAFADIARFYGCGCGSQAALTDAKTPSYEAGAQKAMAALAGALATGYGSLEGGLLSADEMCSPVQLVLDAELTEVLRETVAEPELDETDADEVTTVGPGGCFIGTETTAARHRELLRSPLTWSGQTLVGWSRTGSRNDVDRAREVALELMAANPAVSHISEEEELALWDIIIRTRPR